MASELKRPIVWEELEPTLLQYSSVKNITYPQLYSLLVLKVPFCSVCWGYSIDAVDHDKLRHPMSEDNCRTIVNNVITVLNEEDNDGVHFD